MRKLILFLFLSSVISHLSLAEVRYVSHSGSNTPPYLTWETAADSIMSAINISSFGDTIYVANGVYEEQVVMIPGLSLIGAGMDSCVIDTRALITSNGFISVDVSDSCLFQGFNIKVYYNTTKGYGIVLRGQSIARDNQVDTSWYGMYASYTGSKIPVAYRNILNNVHTGIDIFNSSALIRGNIIYTDLTYRGINIGAFDYFYTPLIDSNYIVAGQTGISMVFGTKATISNNKIFLIGNNSSYGIIGGNEDTMWVYNNFIYAANSFYGLSNFWTPAFNYNNISTGQFTDAALLTGNQNVVKNNNITKGIKGVVVQTGHNPIVQYNNSWANDVNYSGLTPDSTNLSVNPMVVNEDSTQGNLDFHLQKYSPLIDRGDPDIQDKDGTRSDIGLYGGPFGESYKYQDLPPRVPVNLTASLDTNYILLQWNKNTEADFNHYGLYRDTTQNFTADSTTFVASVEDTFYLHIRPEGINNLYFKLTAEDNQGNVSEPSEELHIVLTGIKNSEEFTINSYRLFQNYPNPFNPSTKIGYRLKERGYVKLYVYDIKGELVQTLVNQYQERGYYEVNFEVKSQESKAKSDLASGVYIYQVLVSNEHNIPVFSDIKKMIHLK